jgi:predicted RNase H-like nuclease (RuvC/YqgF family)
MLRGELKSKATNIEQLERQLRVKSEEYSKLERRVESLGDELSL